MNRDAPSSQNYLTGKEKVILNSHSDYELDRRIRKVLLALQTDELPGAFARHCGRGYYQTRDVPSGQWVRLSELQVKITDAALRVIFCLPV
jgi:hypothetical protein